MKDRIGRVQMTEEAPVTWLTQEAFDRLSEELAYATTTGREEIAQKIQAAREEGDLKENGGYHAAKEEQGKQEARIRVLTELLRNVTVGAAPESEGIVVSGTVVRAEISGEESVFLLGSREIAGESELDVYSEQSPLGSAILGLAVGASAKYTAPNGRTITVTINAVETYSGQ